MSQPETTHASDAVASLQYQVRVLQEQINVLELTKREFVSDQRAYKFDKGFFDSEIKRLDKAQSDDKASFDSQIAKVQREMDSFPGILARVQTLENSMLTSTPPVQPSQPSKPWYRVLGTEQPDPCDSRPDTHPQVRVSALLHKMHDLRI